mmetsp:Transcript_19877/g.22939  ORF Transcript_19877/g.22939 Transcript_19877/m.22939 type:complete len:429 (-) Transcript_19877:393-1679(-)
MRMMFQGASQRRQQRQQRQRQSNTNKNNISFLLLLSSRTRKSTSTTIINMSSCMILVIFVLFISSSSSSFFFVEGGIMTGFQRNKMPVNVDDVVHTFERAERYFQRHLQQQQQEQEMEIPVVVVNDDADAEAIDEEEAAEEFDPLNNPTNADPPSEDGDADAVEEEADVVAAPTPTVTTTNVKIGNPDAVTPTTTTATTTTSIKLGTTVHDDANPPSFTTKITTKPAVSPTTKTPTTKPTKKPSYKAPTPAKPYQEDDHHNHDHESDVMKFKDIQVSRQQTGPRGGKKDPSPNIQPTELSFMIIMDDYNYSNDAETTHDIGIGTKFAFTGRIVTKAEELGTAVGTCTVTSDENLNLSYCEVFHKISTDNYGGFGIVHTAGTADEVGGRFLITGTGGSLSKDAATDQGYAMVQFDPAGNPVLYVLLKLF